MREGLIPIGAMLLLVLVGEKISYWHGAIVAIIFFIVSSLWPESKKKQEEREKRSREIREETERANAEIRNKKAEQDYLLEQARIKNEQEERNRVLEIKQKEEEEYQKELKRIEDIEAAKARGKAKGLAELYKTQIDLLIEYKSKGIEIEKEVYSMREKLLSLEREENNAMIQDLMATLDKL